VEGPRITAAISPDGVRLAFVARGPAGKQQLATRLLDQPKATLLSGTENAADPFFSPDGQWIGFFADGKMKKISVQGGAAVTLCDAPGARGASWGEDGWIVVTLIPTPGGGLSRVPAAGGTPQALTKPGDKGEATHRWPQILPGGQAVLFTGNTVIQDYDNASIEVLSLKTGQWKVVQRGGYFGLTGKRSPAEDLGKAVELLRFRPMQLCMFLKALLGTEVMERIMNEAIAGAKQVE
jgi:serine/threonine-protein kinase